MTTEAARVSFYPDYLKICSNMLSRMTHLLCLKREIFFHAKKNFTSKKTDSTRTAAGYRNRLHAGVFLTFHIQQRLLADLEFVNITLEHSYQRRL